MIAVNDITWVEHIWNKIINFFNPLGFPVDERAGGYRLWEERKSPPKYSWFWILFGFGFCGLASCAVSVSSAYAYGNYQHQQSSAATLTALAPAAEITSEVQAEITAELTAEQQPPTASSTPTATNTVAVQIESLPTRILPTATNTSTPTDIPPTQHPGTLTAEAFRLLPTFTLTPSLVPMSTRPINRSEVQHGQAPIQQPVQQAQASVRVLSTNVVIAPLADNWQASATANPFWLIASSTPLPAEITVEVQPPTASSTPTATATDAPLPAVLPPRDNIPTLEPTATGNS